MPVFLFMLLADPAQSSGAFRKTKVATVKMSSEEVKEDLMVAIHQSLAKASDKGKGSLVDIGRSLINTFESLPKNEAGHLEGPAIRYLVHSYFVKEHGWLIRGLEPHLDENSTFEDLGDKEVPEMTGDDIPAFVQTVLKGGLKEGQQDTGFRLSDVVAMVAILRNLILNEGLDMLHESYLLNGHHPGHKIKEEELATILDSYMVLLTLGKDANGTHPLEVAKTQTTRPAFPQIQIFTRDILGSVAFEDASLSNPFIPREFTWEEAAVATMTASRGHGKYRDFECQDLRDGLAELDPKQTGRVDMRSFYMKRSIGPWQLSESIDFLRQLGALDESSSIRGPQVIIPNYVTAVSNCDSPSQYFSVCCIHSCEDILNSIETGVKQASATPEDLISIVGNLSSGSINAPRNLSTAMTSALSSVAELHGGEVPLHGRLFAQWLHYAFPHECPYPHMSKGFNPLTSSEWFAQKGKDAMATEDEVSKYSAGSTNMQEEEVHSMSQWTLEEEMRAGGKAPLREEFEAAAPRSAIGSFFSFIVKIAMVAAVGMALYRTWSSMADSTQVPFLSKKKMYKLDEHLL
eukprot:gnl/MRDRNA2_/MRDRNA2_82043_c0_seq1.p1 gnl/MRDRNA2_/MRDRNA2_82043_c0~~gnl/MRDRNA2_/MRDRNA2_82043_c0_seq1.p1  ORF type:complete len:609 (+),score=122.05 gnl/MRDRNA2_/MRDRNA2_82043_c0_seq1:105-1829(+)